MASRIQYNNIQICTELYKEFGNEKFSFADAKRVLPDNKFAIATIKKLKNDGWIILFDPKKRIRLKSQDPIYYRITGEGIDILEGKQWKRKCR